MPETMMMMILVTRSDPLYSPGYSRLVLTHHNNFPFSPVNTSHSCVHLPASVLISAQAVSQALGWSSKLEEVFKENYKQDPTLYWQYFASSTGFLRYFPAAQWVEAVSSADDPRMRDWYIRAATGHKVMNKLGLSCAKLSTA